MPQLILPIDEIARQKQRDVLFVAFPGLQSGDDPNLKRDTYKPRKQVIAFLKANHLPWSPCAYPSNSGWMSEPMEMIYLDIPYDLANPQYQKVAEYLETPEGTPRDPRVRFKYMPLANALLIEPEPLDSGF